MLPANTEGRAPSLSSPFPPIPHLTPFPPCFLSCAYPRPRLAAVRPLVWPSSPAEEGGGRGRESKPLPCWPEEGPVPNPQMRWKTLLSSGWNWTGWKEALPCSQKFVLIYCGNGFHMYTKVDRIESCPHPRLKINSILPFVFYLFPCAMSSGGF